MQHEPLDDFKELLAILNDEELLRVRHRFNKKAKVRMVDIMTTEIRKREAAWQEERRCEV